jgi:signal transduction histidine kinase
MITLYRFLQEALTNVTRHAQASKIWVELSVEENWISLTVQDNGVGFDHTAKAKGIGITGLEERLTLVGGTLLLNSTAERGTIISARLPLA